VAGRRGFARAGRGFARADVISRRAR